MIHDSIVYYIFRWTLSRGLAAHTDECERTHGHRFLGSAAAESMGEKGACDEMDYT